MSKSPSSIRRQDSNPQPFKHESSPITTRPGLLPTAKELYRAKNSRSIAVISEHWFNLDYISVHNFKKSSFIGFSYISKSFNISIYLEEKVPASFRKKHENAHSPSSRFVHITAFSACVCGGLHQRRDRKFSISLQKRSRLPSKIDIFAAVSFRFAAACG